ncbi:hypothetical protein QJQ45_024948 [Haematococcus lacustris]|nr:hypothetical protein QJQ45_024948 [Haematococcus lacustris]
MAMGMWDAGHGWMDDVDSDDDLEIVIAVGILPLLLAAILPLVADLAPPQRLPRMGCFYKFSMKPFWGNEEFRRALRVNRDTFMWLKGVLRPHIRLHNTQRGLSSGQRLSIALWYLASGSTMQTVAGVMHCSIATVWRAVHDVVFAIVHVMHDQVRMPDTLEQMQQNAAKFFARGVGIGGTPTGIPQIFAAVDGTHIACRNRGLRQLYNRKGFCSMNVQGVVDADGLFMDVQVGNPGSMHDSRAFEESDLWWHIMHGDLGQLLWEGGKDVGGVWMPLSIVADSAYRCQAFVMPAIKHTTAVRNPAMAVYNAKLTAAR